jgi:hypothetical protein
MEEKGALLDTLSNRGMANVRIGNTQYNRLSMVTNLFATLTST